MNKLPEEIWVVEDDIKIASLLGDYLQHSGFSTELFTDGAFALQRLHERQPSLLILDLMLPGLDGMNLCRSLRDFCAIPVIMLTARVDEVDRLLGLDIGADDYICKPFSPLEVVARVRAQLRRANAQMLHSQPTWEIDEEALRITWAGHQLSLTPLEFRLLRVLLSRPGKVFSRQLLLDAAYSEACEISDRAVDSHIKNVRRKLEELPAKAPRIFSVYGMGYRLE